MEGEIDLEELSKWCLQFLLIPKIHRLSRGLNALHFTQLDISIFLKQGIMFPTRSTYNKKGKKNMAKKIGEKTYNTRDSPSPANEVSRTTVAALSRDQLYVG